ncbi:MAG: hypothetical protein ACRELX_01080 [Longimicrobiales bacterium]
MSNTAGQRSAAEAAVLQALARFRNARDEAAAALILRAGAAEDAPRRREEAVERGERELGLDPAFAGLVYDIAREEGLEPGFAFELVHSGIGVCAAPHLPADETIMEGPPSWIAPEPPAAPPPERERRLRASFRRLRCLLERHPPAEAAIVAFVNEPDVGECPY